MNCHHCGAGMKLVDAVTYPAGAQYPWEHKEALWECPRCGKDEVCMNGFRERHPDPDFMGGAEG